jgi:arylsulfatase A-like enzyme
MVDNEIGKVLDALSSNGFEENTIIVFTSDHGDGAASHKWAAKLSLYEESAKVPMIISWKQQISTGIIDQKHLVSQIDIVPTLCDYAGIKVDLDFTGKSWRSIIEDQSSGWRQHLVVELADYKPDLSRKGRMLRTERFKYNVYSSGERREQFFDVVEDPGEMINLENSPSHQKEVERHRRLLWQWINTTGDTFRP